MKTPTLSSSLLLFPFLALGIYLGSRGLSNIRILLLALGVLSVVWLGMAYKGQDRRRWLFPLIVGLAAISVGQVSLQGEKIWLTPKHGEFTGQIYSAQTLSYDQRLLVRLEAAGPRIAVHLPLDAFVRVGDELKFTGTISQPRQGTNPGVFCYRSYLRRLGVFGVSYPEEYEVMPKLRQGFLKRIRNRLQANIEQDLREPGLALALVLGKRDQLSSSRMDTWRRLGISHLLAISGMHVGFVAMGLGLVVNRLRINSVVKLVMVQAGLLAYIVVAGSGASGWRALLVSLLGGYASFRGSRQDSLHLWATAGWLLLLFKPSMLFDLGFTLSFAASGGILLWVPSLTIKAKNKLLTYVMNSLIVSSVAQLSLVPLLMNYFGELAIMGPLATLIFLPCIIVLLIGGLLVSIGLGPFGVGASLNAVMTLIEALENLLLPLAWQWPIRAWGSLEVYLWWGLFIYAGWRFRRPRLTRPRRTQIQLIALAIVLLFITCLPPVIRRPLEVTAINVGQGDCYYIRTPSGRHILIDGGGDSPYWQQRGRDVGLERVVPYLQYRQVQRLDYVILTHPHDDHLFGLLAVLEHFEVGMVVDNGHEHTSVSYERYLDFITEKQIPYHVARTGHNLNLGDGITLAVLYPRELRPALSAAHNNNSLLLRLQFGGIRLLFTGDLEHAVLYDLAHDAEMDLRAQWLKVPHHGSRNSLVDQFYQKVDPKWAMISVGPNNFGHPHQEVLDLLDNRGITWRSTMDGAETFQVWWGVWGRFKRSSS